MYYTPGWGILLTSAIGVVGVGGTLASAWITQRYTDTRFERERRDRHYQDQRQSIGEVVSRAASLTINARFIGDWLMEEPPRQESPVLDQSFEEYYADVAAWTAAVTVAKLIIGDAAVLDSLGALNGAVRAVWQMMASGYDGAKRPPNEWREQLADKADAVDKCAVDLTNITRQQFWSTNL
ncbi:hypothetical protein NOVA_17935 [Nocardia nova]|uniref:hypothetical protein n=1 Tax=Nocardia nova TaxID=37330 RepID=UPI001C497B1B|nr:hypothetical protein [Nocardia nova]MBV7704655.1 hypothetical protein [Nocardia nova]